MGLTTGMDRNQFHDKAWALYQAKALDDAKLPKLSVYTIRTLWNALYDSMPTAAPTQGADARPFANCRYRICDLPGQCRDEGHCHHPASGERGADARPVAIYQISPALHSGMWVDTDAEHYADYLDDYRRIVYATRDAAPSDGQIIGWWDSAEASGFRWKEGIVRGDFSDGTPIYAAIGPREET